MRLASIRGAFNKSEVHRLGRQGLFNDFCASKARDLRIEKRPEVDVSADPAFASILSISGDFQTGLVSLLQL
jgi:hypothetical protein